MISQSEISQIAFKQRKPDKVIEKDYVITWLLLGLADSRLSKLLAFKGGTALKKIYFPDYRYSEDLDFTLLENADEDALIDDFRALLRKLAKSQAFQFDLKAEKIERRSDTLTYYIDYTGPLQVRLGSRDIKVDITLTERLMFPIEEKVIISPYTDSKELRKKIKVYSLEEVLTEKLCALISRTEPRDLYDLYYLFELGNPDCQAVAEAFPIKAQSKHIDRRKLQRVLQERQSTIARLWENRLAHQVDELPHLEAVIRKTNRYFRQYGMA